MRNESREDSEDEGRPAPCELPNVSQPNSSAALPELVPARGRPARLVPRTAVRGLPELHSIHKGTVMSLEAYGAFVRLGDGSKHKDGLLHISRISTLGWAHSVRDVLRLGEAVWAKVVELKEGEGKHSLDMRHIRQSAWIPMGRDG